VFGCETCDCIPNEKHKIMQPKSEQCIFIGYVEDVKTYWLFVPHTLDVIFQRDVWFDEISLPCVCTSSSFSLLSSSYSSSLWLVYFLKDDSSSLDD